MNAACSCPTCVAVSEAALTALRANEAAFGVLRGSGKTTAILAAVLFVAREFRRLEPSSRRTLVRHARSLLATLDASKGVRS